MKGRESRGEVTYDHARGSAEYHFKETFFLRRLRIVDDVVPLPATSTTRSARSSTTPIGSGRRRPIGRFVTHVVRRKLAPNEGPDDVQTRYRAELVPFKLDVGVDATTRNRSRTST